MRIRRLITIVALVITASTTTALSASATTVRPAAASPWFKAWLTAGSGGGCATFASDQRLAPIISEPCTSTNWWYYRDLSASRPGGAYAPGDKLEWVDQSKTFALGFSGGLFKLETPDANTTYVQDTLDELPSKFAVFTNQAGTGSMAPNGRGLDVMVIFPLFADVPDDGWVACPNDTPSC